VKRLHLHLATALLALLGILPCSLSQTYSPSQNPYNTKAAELRRNFAAAHAPDKAVVLQREYALRAYVSDDGALRSWFETIARDPATEGLVREEALRYTALMQSHAGDLQRAQATWTELGLVRDWSVIGPFAEEAPAELHAGIQGETEYKDRGAVRTWRAMPQIGTRGMQDLSHLFPNVNVGTVFAATSLHADAAKAMTLRFGADSAIRVFVNGNQVFAGEEAGFGFDQHSVAVELQAGENNVVLELKPSAHFSLRVTSGTTEDLLIQARQAVEAQPNSAEALDTLAQLEQARGITDAWDHFEEAARLSPTAERWLRVAAACTDSNCMSAALNAAQTANATNSEVFGRLAEYYASRGQTQKARMLLAKALSTAPGDFVLRVDLADLYLTAGLNAQGLSELWKVERQYSNVAWAAHQVAARYEAEGLLDRARALDTAALSHEFDDATVRRALANIYSKRGETTKLRTLYSDALKLDGSDTRAIAALARLDAGSGKPQAAEAELRSAIALAPGDAELQKQLSDVRALASEDSNIESARTADPDGAYVVNASELATKTHAAPPSDVASAVELAEVRVEHVAENGLSVVRTQQVAYIGDDQGARDYATRTVTYTAGAQKLQVLHARVFKADGRIMNAETLNDSGPSEATSAIYYDTRTRTLRYPALERGDVVEFDYRLTPETTVNPYGDYFGALVSFGSSFPRKLQRYVLITPAARPLHITGARLPKANESRTQNELVYTWEMRNLPPLPNEPKGPATTEVAPYVHASTFGSWQQVGRWYAQLIAPQFRLDAALRDVLAKLTDGKTSDEAKITAIHHFVLHNTHYVALEFGVFTYKPYPVSQVYARRFGDCKDKAALMIALLRASGIDADLALVRSRRLGDVSGDATSISIFNHAVVYIPKYDLWLDGTAEYAGSHELPIDDQGAQALTVSLDGEAQLRRIPVTLPMQNYTHRQVRAQIQPDGRIQFTGSAYTRGEDAPGLRREYEVAERQRVNFRNRLAEVLPAVRLDSVEVNGAHDLESDVVVNFSGDLDSSVGKKSVSLTPSWMMRSYVQTLAPLTSRTEDLVLPAPWTTEEELHFLLPSGAHIESLPDDTNLDTPFGLAAVHYHRQGNELLVKTSVQFRKLRVTPAEYAAFRDFCTQVENAFRSAIKVGL
jgi:transglutaminase-like putative cysteine protease/tetratricopeptide (TPR) repeat protein